jgi:glycerol-3-phosphate dehydrogenase (NAD(P)+)
MGEFRNAVGIVGAGRVGLALAEVVARNGHEVVLLTSLSDRATAIRKKRHVADVLPEVARLNDAIRVTMEPAELAEAATLVLLTMSHDYFDLLLPRVGAVLDGAHLLVHAVHALHGNELERVSEIVGRQSCVKQIGCIAGPTQVSDLLENRPNAAVVGSAFPAVIRRCQQVLSNEHWRIYGSKDLRGVELAASLGQIVAITLGICDGLGLGAATHATLLTRGLDEIARIGQALGAEPRTFTGLAGLGRLVEGVRRGEANYQLGIDLAQSTSRPKTVADAPIEAQGAGVARYVAAWAEANHREYPLCRALVRVMDGSQPPAEAMRTLVRIEQFYE